MNTLETSLQQLREELPYRPREIKTFVGMANTSRVKRKLRKLGTRGWTLKSSERRAVYSRQMEYILERPQVTKAEEKALGWR